MMKCGVPFTRKRRRDKAIWNRSTYRSSFVADRFLVTKRSLKASTAYTKSVAS